MSAKLPTGPSREWVGMKLAVREAMHIGASFRISGADVIVDGAAKLPDTLVEALGQHDACGRLRDYLGGTDPDDVALDLVDQLAVDPVLVETRADARLAIRRLISDIRRYGGYTAIDIETAPRSGYGEPRPCVSLNTDGALSARQPEYKSRAGLDPHQADIQLLQLYAGGERCFIFRREALALVLPSHWLRRQKLVAHNAQFEFSFLRHHVGYRPPPHRRIRELHCTTQATGLLIGVGFGGENRSLVNAAKHFLGVDVPKDLQKSDWSARNLSLGQIAYAAGDAVIAHRLWPIVRRELVEKERWDAYELQRKAIASVADMELRGLGFDQEQHASQTQNWSQELTNARREYHDLTGASPPSSLAEVREWLASVIDQHQMQRWPRTDTGEPSISYKHLQRLVHIPSTRPVLAILAMEKLISTFGPKLATYVNPVTGRIHCDYNLAVTKSGRFSASHPNLQQLPARKSKAFKKCIVAAPGNLLVGGDWSQVEMRAAAWISGDRALTEIFRNGQDIHCITAAAIAGVSPDSVTGDQRQAAKPVNFGSIYGIGPKSLAESAFMNYGIEMTEREARSALARFFDTYRGFDKWRKDNYCECKRLGRIRIGAGRVVEGAWEPDGLSLPQCCNLPVQGICADAMLRALIATYGALHAAGVRGGLVACVHDELLLEVHEDDADRAAEILNRTMTNAFVQTFPGAPTTGLVDVSTGRSWFDLKG